MDAKKQTVAVGLSGGVDSAATAYLLQKNGYRVIGLTLKVTSFFDVNDAVMVADALGIEHHVLDEQDLFKEKVIEPFIDAYIAGKTPNPCLYCNQHIKYGMMLDKAIQLGADYMALGHYANIDYDEKQGLYYLKKAQSLRKDQSYNLYMLTQKHLSKLMFPLGMYDDKEKVRAIVKDMIPNISQKKDSQDICFIEKGNHIDYIKTLRGDNFQGKFVDEHGKELGNHSGVFNYTIGQKRKLEVIFNPPKFVIDIDATKKQVILGEDGNTYKKGIIVDNVNYILPSYQEASFEAVIKLCQWGYDIKATIEPFENGKVKVIFEKPERAPAPGQGVVFYQGDVVIGGGMIDSVFR